jgi:hypothetical protein
MFFKRKVFKDRLSTEECTGTEGEEGNGDAEDRNQPSKPLTL